MTDFVAAFNVAEAAWWIGVGVALPFLPIRPDAPRCRRALAADLIAFGLSDAVEVFTGAWWRPWWLAALKVACGATIAASAFLWFRKARRRS